MREKVYKLRQILLAVRAEAAKPLVVVFLCQHQTLQTTLLQFPTAQETLLFFQFIFPPGVKKLCCLVVIKSKSKYKA